MQGRLGATPAEARRPASLSEEVSYHTGLHRTEIGQLERGLRPVRIETDALRVSVEEPLDGIILALRSLPATRIHEQR